MSGRPTRPCTRPLSPSSPAITRAVAWAAASSSSALSLCSGHSWAPSLGPPGWSPWTVPLDGLPAGWSPWTASPGRSSWTVPLDGIAWTVLLDGPPAGRSPWMASPGWSLWMASPGLSPWTASPGRPRLKTTQTLHFSHDRCCPCRVGGVQRPGTRPGGAWLRVLRPEGPGQPFQSAGEPKNLLAVVLFYGGLRKTGVSNLIYSLLLLVTLGRKQKGWAGGGSWSRGHGPQETPGQLTPFVLRGPGWRRPAPPLGPGGRGE